jgi:type 1 glutamine amidotransferase
MLLSVKALVLSGGVAHPYRATSEQLREILSGAGIGTTVTEDLDRLASISEGEFDLLVLNCVRWTCEQTPQWADEWRYYISQEIREGMLCHLSSGGGLLALHAATICFDDWPEFRDIIGAWWEWGSSGHAPYGLHAMKVRRKHPIVEGIPDFVISDELYTDPVFVEPVDPLVTAEWNGREHPIMWVRSYGGGRVCYCALGHDEESFENEWFRRIIERASLWAVGLPTEDVRE